MANLGRSLYVGLKADTKGFAHSLKKTETNLDRFKRGVKAVGTAVATSFAAMGAAAVLFGKSAIDAALEDQKAMTLLAKTVSNNTKVNKKYQHTVEQSITKLQQWYNISDDKLRPAMGKLVIATKSLSVSQKLMRTALNVSATTGRDLTEVATALGKAYNGNTTALKRLGLGFSDAELKGKPFNEILGKINEKTSGAAAAQAGTYAGQIEGLKIAWQEFMESVGYKLLPYVKGALTFIKEDLMPWLGQIKDGFSGTYNDKVTPKLKAMAGVIGADPDKPAAVTLGESLKTMATAFGTLMTELTTKGPNGASSLDQIASSLTAVADAITSITNAIRWLVDAWNKLPKGVREGGVLATPGAGRKGIVGGGVWSALAGLFGMKATGGLVQGRTSYIVGERGPELFTPSGAGTITPNHRLNSSGGTTHYTINMNGIVDADSARRAIEQVLRNSAKRLGPIDLVGSAL